MHGMGYSTTSSGNKLIGFGPTTNNQDSMGTLVIDGVREIFAKVSSLNSTLEKSSQHIHPIISINKNFDEKTNAISSSHLPGVAGGGWSDDEDLISSSNIQNISLKESNDFNENLNGEIFDKEKIYINNEYLVLDSYLEAAIPFSHFQADSLLKDFQSQDLYLYLNEKLKNSNELKLMKILILIEVILYHQEDVVDLKRIFFDVLTELSLQNQMPNVQYKSKKILMILFNT